MGKRGFVTVRAVVGEDLPTYETIASHGQGPQLRIVMESDWVDEPNCRRLVTHKMDLDWGVEHNMGRG